MQGGGQNKGKKEYSKAKTKGEKSWLKDPKIIVPAAATVIAAIVGAFLYVLLPKFFPPEPRPPKTVPSVKIEEKNKQIIIELKEPEPSPRPTIEEVKELKEQRLALGKRVKIDAKEGRLNDFKSLINRSVFAHRGKRNVALVIESRRFEEGISPAAVLCNLLSTEKVNIIPNFFKEKLFIEKGFFGEIYAGNTDLLRQTDTLSSVDCLILGKLDYLFSKGASIESALVSCNINFSYKVISNNGDIVRSDNIRVIGPGFSEEAALERGLEILSETYSDRILRTFL